MTRSFIITDPHIARLQLLSWADEMLEIHDRPESRTWYEPDDEDQQWAILARKLKHALEEPHLKGGINA